MATAGPVIVSAVIGNVKVESESLAVQRHRTVDVRHLENDGDEAILLTGHQRIMP